MERKNRSVALDDGPVVPDDGPVVPDDGPVVPDDGNVFLEDGPVVFVFADGLVVPPVLRGYFGRTLELLTGFVLMFLDLNLLMPTVGVRLDCSLSRSDTEILSRLWFVTE